MIAATLVMHHHPARFGTVAFCLVLLASALVSSGEPPRAHAESAIPPCVPSDVIFDPPGGDVPANWPVFSYVTTPIGSRDWRAVRLVRVSDGSTVPASTQDFFGGGLAPRESLVPGEDYDLYQPVCLGAAARATRYHAIAPIAEPPSLGTVTVSPLYAAYYARGATNRYYFVDVLLEPDPGFEAEPWASKMHWTAEADGVASYDTYRWTTEHRARVLVSCGSTSGEGLPLGDHTLRGVAYAVRDAVRFSTPEVTTTITIEGCAAALRVDAATLRPLTATEIVHWDSPEMDAGVPVDCGPSMDGGRLCTSTERDTDSNCSIAAGHRGSAAPWAILALAITALARRRRRPTAKRAAGGAQSGSFARALLACATAACVTMLAPIPTVRATSDAGPPPIDMGHCPADTTQILPNGQVPANFGGVVLVTRGSGAPTAAELRVEWRDAVGGPVALAFTVVPIDATQVRVQITDTLVAGATVRVSVQPCADIGNVELWTHSLLIITPTAPEPTNLGRLVGPQHSDVHFDGTTWYQVAYYFPSDEARPWQSAYWASLEIDGVIQSVQDSLAVEGFLRPNNPVACPGSPPGGLAPGPHTFRLAGGPWGEPARAYTDPFTVTVDCPPPGPPESRGCIDFGLYPDGGPAGGYCPIDAGPPPPFDPSCFDAGEGAVCTPDAGSATPRSSGCASVTGASGGPVGVGGAFIVGVMASLAMRRRRRAPSAPNRR